MYLNFQRIWLKQQLSESQSVFNIVIVHHPPYSAGEHGNREIMQWDFHGMGIDVVFSGHDHVYNRIEKREEKGTFYVVNGLGGKDTSNCSFNPLSPEKFNSFCYGGNYGAVKATATHSRLVVGFYTIDSPLQPIDSVVINK
jgi:3',5'-cyclic AMP phosphodiesterase CpdA